MKCRDGHVSNSSSTSFVLMVSMEDAVTLMYDLDPLMAAFAGTPRHKRIGDQIMAVYKGSEYLGGGMIARLEKVLDEKIPGRFSLETKQEGAS